MMEMRKFYIVGWVVLGIVTTGSFSAGAVADGACPNEQLRVEDNSTLLPDCRSYEMMTPPYKEGQAEKLFTDEGEYASSGDGMLFVGTPDLVGSSGAGERLSETSLYADSRTVNGWQFSPLNPSGSEYDGQYLLSAEPDSGVSLWEQKTPAQLFTTRELYVRSAEGVSMLVGPTGTPTASVGEPSNSMAASGYGVIETMAATSDYSHIVLRAFTPEDRWPFDKTLGGETQLYEYSGVDDPEPIMVAVEGAKGSARIEGFECGAELGSGDFGATYNALSSDGETVFFTPHIAGRETCPGSASAPAVAEVWARMHGSLSASLPAETVDVSARSASECTGACASSPESAKNFEGASEDGEKAFFTSTQQLINGASQDPDVSDSAGSEGSGCAETSGSGGCNLYEFDMQGRQLRLVAGGAEVLGVAGIAKDGSRVYFVAKRVLAGSGANVYGAVAQGGEPNLYVYDSQSGQTVFVATLSPGDQQDWARQFTMRPVQVTGEAPEEGRFLLFASTKQNLTPDDPTAMTQLFEYDSKTGELVRVSQGEDGYDENGNAVREGVESEMLAGGYVHEGTQQDFHSLGTRLNISRDGSTVAFTTRGRLSVRATSAEQGCTSVYEYRSAGAIANGGVHLISDGVDVVQNHNEQCGASLAAMDASGDDIAFRTDDPLLSSDVDGLQLDTYDARVDGGFPAAVPAAECKDEGCLGPVGVGPASSVAASAAQTAEGGLSSGSSGGGKPAVKKAVRCAKGKRLSHDKCVRIKVKRKQKTKAKKASRNRKAGR